MRPREVVEAAWEAIGRNDWDAMDHWFAPDYIRHASADYGRDEYRTMLRAEHAAFPDIRFTLHDWVEDDERAAFRWRSTGTHLGPYLGIPPTGRPIAVSGITISRVADGRIVEDHASWSKFHLLEALGILTETSHARGDEPTRPSAPADDVRAFHRRFGTGVTIVTADADGPRGLAVNAFSSISLDPPLVLVCVAATSQTYDRLFRSDEIAVHVLAHDQAAVARTFATSGADKFGAVAWSRGENGAPVLAGCAAHLEAEITTRMPAHSHTIFIARVTRAVDHDRPPLVYLGGRFFDGSALAEAP